MNRQASFIGAIAGWWQSARPRLRLAVGSVLIAAIGLAGLTPVVFFSMTLSWPFAALIAAAGWGRSGFGFGPMAMLIIFGFAQDVTASAPLGSFALINLATYGASVAVSQTFEIERSRGMNYGLPMLMLVFGMTLVWLLASFAGGHVARIGPLTSALLATIFLHMLIAPVFDLGIRRGNAAGAAG